MHRLVRKGDINSVSLPNNAHFHLIASKDLNTELCGSELAHDGWAIRNSYLLRASWLNNSSFCVQVKRLVFAIIIHFLNGVCCFDLRVVPKLYILDDLLAYSQGFEVKFLIAQVNERKFADSRHF